MAGDKFRAEVTANRARKLPGLPRVVQVFLRYTDEEELMSLIEIERRRVVRVQSCVRRWMAARAAQRSRQLRHHHAARIQAGSQSVETLLLS